MSTQPSESLIAASQWYAILSSEYAKKEDVEAWQRWKADSDDNQLAWQRVEDLGARLGNLPPNIHADSFARKTASDRRQVLKQMAVLLCVSTATYFMVDQKPWQEMLADQSTKTGDMRAVNLADGTQIFINTATAINIDFTAQLRSIKLIKGEILVETAQENANIYRPFSVNTKHGTATALGTKFNVRLFDHHSKVSVYEGAVRINPADTDKSAITLQAGESAIFDEATYKPVQQETSSAWVKGLLVVYSMPLGEFVTELSRYRNGLIRCEPSISQLLVSGSFYINDIDSVLSGLPNILPVKVESRTRYWVTISAA